MSQINVMLYEYVLPQIYFYFKNGVTDSSNTPIDGGIHGGIHGGFNDGDST